MKNKIATLLLITTVLSSTAFGQDFVCQDIYQAKLHRLERTRGIRRVGRIALFSAGGVAGMGLLFFGLGNGALTLAGVEFFGTVFGVPAGASLVDEIPTREDLVRESYEAQVLFPKTEAVLLQEASAKRDEALVVALRKFDTDISYPDYVTRLTNRTNEERRRAGLPFLTPSEVVAVTRENIRATILNGDLNIDNVLADALERGKAKGWIPLETSYDDFRKELIANQEAFCPNGKALKLKTVVRSIYQK
jgi:hypothetical protein